MLSGQLKKCKEEAAGVDSNFWNIFLPENNILEILFPNVFLFKSTSKREFLYQEIV